MTSFFGATRIGEALHAEHQSTIAALDGLERLTDRRSPPDSADPAVRQALEAVAAALEDDVARHFGFEEEHLFPRLAQAGADFMVDMLSGEHDDIRPLALHVRDGCRRLLDGGLSEPEWREFQGTAQDLIERETFHIQKEEMGLLAALSQILDRDTDADLAARHAALTQEQE